MAKRPSNPDAILDRLSALRQVPSSPEFLAELRKAIVHASVVVVARGAELAARYEKKELAGELMAAFRRFSGFSSRDGDGNYTARTAIVRCLVDLYAGGEAADIYLEAARMGGRGSQGVMIADPAAELRATAAFGLVTMAHPAALTVCTDLLADAASMVRVAAVRALTASGREGAVLVMRLKLHVGDRDPDVLAECVTGLMQLLPDESLGVVAPMLRHENDGVRAATALAIGSSKLPTALATLQDAFVREKEPDVSKTILIAAAGTRSQAAVQWLLSLLNRGVTTAADAIDALGPYRLDNAVKDRVAKVVAERGDARLREAVERAF